MLPYLPGGVHLAMRKASDVVLDHFVEGFFVLHEIDFDVEVNVGQLVLQGSHVDQIALPQLS